MTSRLEDLVKYLEYAQDKLDDAQFVMSETNPEDYIDMMAQLRIAQAVIHAVIGKIYIREFRNIRYCHEGADVNAE